MTPQLQQPVSRASDSLESQAKRVTVSNWLIVLMLLLFCWGGFYFDQHGASFNRKVYPPYRAAEEVAAFQNLVGDVDAFDQGKAIYGRICAVCHQASGLGTPGQLPPLAGSEWVQEPEPGRLVRLVLQGLQGPITVKGERFNNTMVPWNALRDRDIAAVLTYVRQNSEWGNNASAVTPDQIEVARDKIQKAHPGPFVEDELLKISPAE